MTFHYYVPKLEGKQKTFIIIVANAFIENLAYRNNIKPKTMVVTRVKKMFKHKRIKAVPLHK